MALWQVQEAKTRLSEMIEEAQSKGPQIITRHGAERAVVLSIGDYRALTARQPDLDRVKFSILRSQIQDQRYTACH